MGDRQHEVGLLWNLGIEHAELGQYDQAVARGQEALSIFRQLGSPVVGEYASHFQRYLSEHPAPRSDGPDGHRLRIASEAFFEGSVVTTGIDQPLGGPGLLRMAVSIPKSMPTP